MIRLVSLSCISLAVALAQGPGLGGRHFGPPLGGPFEGARFLGAEAGMPGHVVKNAPFTADVVTERTQTLSDGNHIKQSTTVHLSRDSEGRTRSEESLSSVAANGLASAATTNRTVVFIHDPVAGASYALNSNNKTATRSMHPHASANASASGQTAQGGPGRPHAAFAAGGGRRGGMNSQNVKTESLGTQSIEGVTAQGTRTTLTIPAGQMGNEQPIQIVTERWYSSDLQATVMVKRSDPRQGDSVTRYTNVTRAEPSPTLFQVPSDYKIQDAGRGGRPANSSNSQ